MTGPRLLFVSATKMEVQAFLDSHDCRKTRGPGYTLFQPRAKEWACLITGPGVFNTAAGLGACLTQFIPDIVIDAGIAGVFPDAGITIGGLALADSDTYAHTGVGDAAPLPFDLIPGKTDSRAGRYVLDSNVLETCRSALAAGSIGQVLTGPFLTVSAITKTRKRAQALCKLSPYLMESMEGAAAAHVCALYQLPMAEIRAGSNITGDRDKSCWDIPGACRTLNRALTCLCDILPG